MEGISCQMTSIGYDVLHCKAEKGSSGGVAVDGLRGLNTVWTKRVAEPGGPMTCSRKRNCPLGLSTRQISDRVAGTSGTLQRTCEGEMDRCRTGVECGTSVQMT